jgi:predicted PolB exonuclease-like 3'-5' exonuclease
VNVLVFDIETVPDVAGARRVYGFSEGLGDRAVAEALFAKRRQRVGREFLPHHLHRVVAIAAVLRSGERFSVWSLGEESSPEEELIRRFFDGIDRYTPDLVSWNGGGFDLPVLHYRSLVHGVSAPRYWETGDEDTAFRWNNYLSRFHARHTDLMDVIAAYQPRAAASLDEIAALCGFPGKLGMSGARVWEQFLAGRLADIRAYCETDVVNTYLVWLRFQCLRGRLDATEYAAEIRRVREALAASEEDHWAQFLVAWRDGEVVAQGAGRGG